MEELSVSLGRITPARRLADVHVSDSTAVSHLHAQIEFRVHHNHYVLVNHAHNGTKLKTIESEDWTEVSHLHTTLLLTLCLTCTHTYL